MNRNYQKLFEKFVEWNLMEELTYLFDLHPTINIQNGFYNACVKGHLQVAQWLYEINPTMDISVENEQAFRYACMNGHLCVAQWLYEIKPTLDISTGNEKAFRYACAKGHLQVT
jgi:hypothetical protein